jgi:hypothetical protein
LRILEQFIEDQPVDLIVVAQAGERVGWHLAEGGPVLKVTRPVKTRYNNCAVKHVLFWLKCFCFQAGKDVQLKPGSRVCLAQYKKIGFNFKNE